MECPTKLYYVNKPNYGNQKLEDSFLESLVEGGFQVAELAKCYYRKYNHSDLNGCTSLKTPLPKQMNFCYKTT